MKYGIYGLQSNDDYHKSNGYLSSSQLSLLLDDPVLFYNKYILKNIPQEHKECFDVGNAFHTALLEPHLFNKEYTFFTGKTRRGDAWNTFKKKHEGKVILGNKQKFEVDLLTTAIKENKIATGLLKGGKSELSVYYKILGVDSKVRFDKINLTGNKFSDNKPFGADLKSTTGLLLGVKGYKACQAKIAGLNYDLSAAFYLDVYNALQQLIADKNGTDYTPIIEWYWIFASKDFKSSRIFRASKLMLENGREKYKIALDKYQENKNNGWKSKSFEDSIENIDPIAYDIILENSKEESAW